MKISAVDIRVGNIIKHDGKLWSVYKTMHTQPGKGGAYMQVEMKDIVDGTKQNIRFRSDETIERVRLDEAEFQYLYTNGDQIELMNVENYEQMSLSINMLPEDQALLLADGMPLYIEFYEDKPVSVKLPETITLEILDCEPVVKGQTVTSSYKPAFVRNGVKVMVPPFINIGDQIVIKTADMEYVERAKNADRS